MQTNTKIRVNIDSIWLNFKLKISKNYFVKLFPLHQKRLYLSSEYQKRTRKITKQCESNQKLEI